MAALAGAGLGAALWGIEGVVHGDALFHLGRIRKLDDLGSLSLRAVDEFKDGGLHPGYAFPLWHGWLALAAKLARVDPTLVLLHESSILAPLALVLAFEMGRVVFRSTSLGVATMLVQVTLIALAPGGGGAYTSLELPGTLARQLLVPAAITLFFRFVRDGEWPRRADARRGGHGPRVRASDVRALHRDAARRLRPRAAARGARGRPPQRDRAGLVRRAGAARLRVARADRRRDALAQPVLVGARDAASASTRPT